MTHPRCSQYIGVVGTKLNSINLLGKCLSLQQYSLLLPVPYTYLVIRGWAYSTELRPILTERTWTVGLLCSLPQHPVQPVLRIRVYVNVRLLSLFSYSVVLPVGVDSYWPYTPTIPTEEQLTLPGYEVKEMVTDTWTKRNRLIINQP